MDETVKALLRDVRVASPCAERWEEMPGSDSVRSCERCRHKVYNLSESTAPEAADLLRKAEGRLCVRFYRRPDGTLLTRDCPSGQRAVRRRLAGGMGVAFVSLLVLSLFDLGGKPVSEYPPLLRFLANNFLPSEALGRVAESAAPLAVPSSAPLAPVAFSHHPAADRQPQACMGKVVLQSSADYTDSGTRPFLHDFPVDNGAPRPDPFVKIDRHAK